MLITQMKAIAQMRAETGLSIAACTRIVRGLPMRRDGKRNKVRLADVRLAINDAIRPVPVTSPPNMRPISQRQIDRVRFNV